MFDRGDFSFADSISRQMLEDAFQAVTVTESWEYIAKDPVGGSFILCADKRMMAINEALKFDGHSGGSYGWTMRTMQLIARVGWDAYLANYLVETMPYN